MEINKIYHMDTIKGITLIEDNFIDLVITDPPYNITNNEWDIFEENDFLLFTELWMKECYRITKGKYLLMFWSQQKIGLIDKLHTQWILKRIIIWNMPNAPIHNQDGLIFTWQPCILFEKKNNEGVINNGQNFISADVLIHSFQAKERFGHPTIKPLNLIKELLKKYSGENNLVLDPFMGSGTTAVACKQLNRNFIGFEISKEYCDIANRRLEQDNIKKWF